MLGSILKRKLGKFKRVSLVKQTKKAVILQDEVGKQNFHEDMKKVFEPMTDIVKDVSTDISKTIRETSIKNNKAISDLNEKCFKING